MLYSFDPLAAATQGFLYKKSDNTYGYDPFTISVNGILVQIFEDVITPTGITKTRRIQSGTRRRVKYTEEPEKVKLITVKCIVNGIEYIQTKQYKNLKVTAKDIGVDINTENPTKPKIKIFIEK